MPDVWRVGSHTVEEMEEFWENASQDGVRGMSPSLVL